jgi:hypothetical protein
MLMEALICMSVATLALAVGVCFTNKTTPLSFLLRTLSLVALVCLGIVVGNYKNDFSGYTILLILSVTPQFVSLFDLREYLKNKKLTLENAKNEEFEEELDKITEDVDENQNKKRKKENKHYFLNSNGNLLAGISALMSSVCVGFCGIYLGLETFYGFVIGAGVGFALTFLALIINKTKNPFDILAYFLSFLAVGIMLGQIVTVLFYATNLTNILYCVGAFCFAIFAFLSSFKRNNYFCLIYFVAMFCLFATIIF